MSETVLARFESAVTRGDWSDGAISFGLSCVDATLILSALRSIQATSDAIAAAEAQPATIATLTAALEEARGVLVASRSFVELVYEETDREEAADAKIVMGQTDAALATIDAALGRVEG